MTISEILGKLETYNMIWMILFCAIPLFTWIYGKIIPKGCGILKPHKYVYSVLVYTSTVPGMFAAILCGYSLFMSKTNLLEVNVVLYFLPVISMILTLVVISKSVNTDFIPGFDRLTGLCMILAVTFILALLLMKTRIFVIFGASFMTLIFFVVVMFLILKWGTHKLFR